MSATRPTIEEDLQLMVGGRFSPDSLGPDRHREILERARSQAAAYLQAFERNYVNRRFDAAQHSRLHLVAVLGQLREAAPAEVRRLAQRLQRLYDTASQVTDALVEHDPSLESVPEETSSLIRRMQARRDALRVLAGT